MKVLIIASLLAASTCYSQEPTQPKAQSKKQDKKPPETDADKIADKILADTNRRGFVTNWYGEVYPALKRKYKNPVSRSLYDGWRERYFQNEVAPVVLEDGYGLESARQEFMTRTEKQPSN